MQNERMDENPNRAPQTDETKPGWVRRLLHHPAFWAIAFLLSLTVLGLVAKSWATKAAIERYREKEIEMRERNLRSRTIGALRHY